MAIETMFLLILVMFLGIVFSVSLIVFMIYWVKIIFYIFHKERENYFAKITSSFFFNSSWTKDKKLINMIDNAKKYWKYMLWSFALAFIIGILFKILV